MNWMLSHGPCRFRNEREPLLLAWDHDEWRLRLAIPPWDMVPVYLYEAPDDAILTLVFEDGTEVQIGRRFPTDLGSVPLAVQSLTGITANCFRPLFLPHDWMFQSGGLWVKVPGDPRWTFRPVSLDEANSIFLLSFPERPEWREWRLHTVYTGLCMGGWVAWHQARRHDDESESLAYRCRHPTNRACGEA